MLSSSLSKLVLLALVAIAVEGCTKARLSSRNAEGPEGIFRLATGHDVSATAYIVDPADTVLVKSPDVKELDGASQVVRADGQITLNLIGQIRVSGLTPAQIDALLAERLSKYFVNPRIQVEILANSKFYYAFGFGAQNVGKKPYTGNNSILSVLSDVQFNESGWPQQVILSRPARNGRDKSSVVVDFTKIMEYAEFHQNYAVEEGDIVYIPLSPISSFTKNVSKVTAPITGTLGAVGSGTQGLNVVRGR